MDSMVEHINLSIDFNNKIDTDLIKLCNNVIDNDNLTDNIISLIKNLNNYINNKNIILSDIETDLLEIEYNLLKMNEMESYYRLFIQCLEFIEPIKLWSFIKLNIRPVNINFINWFLSKTNELKRVLKFYEFISLDSKFNLAVIMGYNFNSMKELNSLIKI